MDKAKRDILLTRVGSVNKLKSNLPLLKLEEFFDGNDDGGSIWCNLPSAPRPHEVLSLLSSIRERPDVSDVRIMVTQFDGGDDEWPFSDTIYFVTAASESDVIDWLGEDFRPDEIWTGDFGRGQPVSVQPGHQVIGAWWD